MKTHRCYWACAANLLHHCTTWAEGILSWKRKLYFLVSEMRGNTGTNHHNCEQLAKLMGLCCPPHLFFILPWCFPCTNSHLTPQKVRSWSKSSKKPVPMNWADFWPLVGLDKHENKCRSWPSAGQQLAIIRDKISSTWKLPWCLTFCTL